MRVSGGRGARKRKKIILAGVSVIAVAASLAYAYFGYFKYRHFNAGLAKFRSGQYAEALQDFSNDIASNPDNADSFLYRGLCGRKLGHTSDATSDLSRAIELDPELDAAYLERGIIYKETGRLTDAAADFTQAIDLNGASAECFFQRGSTYHLLGMFAEAVSDLTKCLSMDGARPDAYYQRALSYVQLGNNDEALRDFDRSIEIDDKNPSVFLARAEHKHARLKDGSGALSDYDKAAGLEPANAAIFMGRAGVRTATGDIQGAIDDYSVVIGIDDRNSAAFLERGKLYLSTGGVQESIADFDKAVVLDPKNPAVFYHRGLSKYLAGDLIESLEDLYKAVGFNDKYWEAWYQMAQCKIRLAKYDGAVADLTKVPGLRPGHAPSLSWRAYSNIELGNFETVLPDLDEAIKIDPAWEHAYSVKGDFLYRNGRFSEANKCYESAFKINAKPDYALRMAHMKHVTADYNGELEDLDKLIAADGELAAAYIKRWLARYYTGHYEQALVDLNKLRRFNGVNSIILAGDIELVNDSIRRKATPAANAQTYRFLSVKLFEAGESPPPLSGRLYMKGFRKSSTRYIWIQLNFKNEEFKGKNHMHKLECILKKVGGGLVISSLLNAKFRFSDYSTWFQDRFGWQDPGNWEAGDYEVEVRVDGAKIADCEFTVYDDIKPAPEGIQDGSPLFEFKEVLLFESGFHQPEERYRQYSSSFPRSTTRFVWCKLVFKNLAFKVEAHKQRVQVRYYDSSGRLLGSPVLNAIFKKDWPEVWLETGWGWHDAGNWKAGAYRIEIRADGRIVGETQFTIYQD